jgi:hypothetical protein
LYWKRFSGRVSLFFVADHVKTYFYEHSPVSPA